MTKLDPVDIIHQLFHMPTFFTHALTFGGLNLTPSIIVNFLGLVYLFQLTFDIREPSLKISYL